MRIAFLGLGRYSGASPIAFHLAEALADLHEVRVFLGREARNLRAWTGAGLDIEIRPVYTSLGGAVLSLLTQQRVRALAASIDRFRPDVLVVPFPHLWVPFLMSRVGRPAVVFVHDPEPHPGLIGTIWHRLERRVVRQARHVIIHSSTFLQAMTSVYGLDAGGVSIVPIGPLTDYRNHAGDDLRTPLGDSRAPSILFFGRLEEYKGIGILLEAVPVIRRAIPGAIVRLVGHGGSRRILERARATPGVEVQHRWVDDSEVPAVFAQADIVVLPYTSATQSGVIPIAAAFALPVVATSTGGLPEQLNHGECGVLVRPGDPVALSEAVIALSRDPAHARRLGRRLHEEYMTRRSWPSIAQAVTHACHAALRQAEA